MVVCILIVGATMLLMNQAYLFTNSTFDSNEYTARYRTELSVGRYIVFTDPNGDEKSKVLKLQMITMTATALLLKNIRVYSASSIMLL